MIPPRFQPGLPPRERDLAADLLGHILGACDPERATRAHLEPVARDTPTHILAFGKAATAMTSGAMGALGQRFSRATVLAPEANTVAAQFKSRLVSVYPCDHPLPTPRNTEAARALHEHARSIPPDHRALVLISGGASAMLCLPRASVGLERIRDLTASMLARGAGIAELNAARSELEELKAGGLAHALAHVRDRRCLLLSDVIGDDPSVIGSGPMLDGRPPSTPHTVIASNATALDALGAWCASRAIPLSHTQRGASGEASSQGQGLAQRLVGSARGAVALGGEPTVDTRGRGGIGGTTLELGLGCALGLMSSGSDWTVIALTTDGIDGPSGAAGCVLTRSMLSAPGAADAARDALGHHDTLSICDTLGATIRTGPTGTNVNDIAIAIRWD